MDIYSRFLYNSMVDLDQMANDILLEEFLLSEGKTKSEDEKFMDAIGKIQREAEGKDKNWIMQKIHWLKTFSDNTVRYRKDQPELASKIKTKAFSAIYYLTNLIDKSPTEKEANEKVYKMFSKHFWKRGGK